MSSTYEGSIVITHNYGLCWVRKQESGRCYSFNIVTGEVKNFPASSIKYVLGSMKEFGDILYEKAKEKGIL